METCADRIAPLINEKILLFQELVNVLKEEKKSITKIDVDALWGFSEKKQRVSKEIEEVRKKILDILSEEEIEHGMNPSTFHLNKVMDMISGYKNEQIRHANAEIMLLKKEAGSLATDNKRYVQQYLGVLDEMIGAISNASDPPPVYGKNKYAMKKNRSSFMLNTEV